jgi:hypothetical protein
MPADGIAMHLTIIVSVLRTCQIVHVRRRLDAKQTVGIMLGKSG